MLGQEQLQGELSDFKDRNAGEQVMRQMRFAWDLLRLREVEEARLHFVTALSKFPRSDFLLREVAASAMFPLARGLHGDATAWVQLEKDSQSFESWESFAFLRFQRPKSYLSEGEAELLAAGMPSHSFVPGDHQGLVLEHRVGHDVELLRLLRALGLLGQVATEAIDTYERILGWAPRLREGVLQPSVEQWHSLYPFHNRRIYVHPCQRLQHPALNPVAELNMRLMRSGKVQSRAGGFLASGGALVIEDLLTPAALGRLRDFAELSTVWYEEKGGYLVSGLNSGFSTPLLAQIAEELRLPLSEVLCDLPLTNVLAFKFDIKPPSVVDLHADDASVHVNLWITADAEGLPDSDNASDGGVTIFDASHDVPVGSERAARSLEDLVAADKENVTVPYRENRAVVFDSTRIYSRRPFWPKSPDFRSRCISVSFLFGARGFYCPQRGRMVLRKAGSDST